MPIKVTCPSCHAVYTFPDHARGKTVHCRRCTASLVAGGDAPKEMLADTLIRTPGEKRPPRRKDGKPEPRTAAGVGANARALTGRRRDVDEEEEQSWTNQKKKQPTIAASTIWIFVLGVVAVAGLVAGAIFLLPSGSADKNPKEAALQPPDSSRSAEPRPDAEDGGKDLPPKDPPPKERGPKDPVVKLPPALGPDGQLLPAVVEKIKRATVALRVTLPDGRLTQGSGFCGVEPQIVLTHARVLGMLSPDARKPQKVEVFLHGAGTDARTLVAEVLGVDRGSELAILRLPADAGDLPKPLEVKSAKDLAEKEPVFVFGLPRDGKPGKDLAVGTASVAELRKDDFGQLSQAQLSGEVHRANAGGPVVDIRGQVVGVAVTGSGDTPGSFAVPGEQALAALNGRIASVVLGQPFWQGQDIAVPVRIEWLDPLRRVRYTGIDCWAGAPGDPRPASLTEPAPRTSDGMRTREILIDRDGLAMGDVKLARLAQGQVYWIQPTYATGSSSSPVWDAATVYELKTPPVARRPAQLLLTHRIGQRSLVLKSQATYKVRDSADEDHTVGIHLDARWTEDTKSFDQKKDQAKVHLQYKSVTPHVRIDGKERPRTPRLQQAIQRADLMAIELVVDRQGGLVENKANLRRVPREFRELREDLTSLNESVQQTLEALSASLPQGTVNVGQSWRAKRTLPIDTTGKPEPAHLELTYTYLGVRVGENGREEAVIGVEGKVRGQRGEGQNLVGRASGTVLLDVASGTVYSARLTVNVDMDMPLLSRPALANGTLEVQLERGAPGG
jgi:S1-C subfamily serine protease